MSGVIASYRFGLPAVLTRGRIIGSVALIVLVLVQFYALPGEALLEAEGITLMTLFLSVVVGILVPVFTVSTASNVLGAAVADSTLVYPWLRPTPRWQIALGHVGAALTLNIPVAVLSSVGAVIALLISADALDDPRAGSFLFGALVAGVAAGVAYTPLVVALGARYKRASTFAFVYIFLWEQLFARNSEGVSRLAIQTYVRSVFYGPADLDPVKELDQVGQVGKVVSPGAAWLVIVLLVVAGTALTALVLKRADVE